MSSFSERFGYKAPAADLAETDMPSSLRNGLWDAIDIVFFNDISLVDYRGRVIGYSGEFWELSSNLWFHFYKQPRDTLSGVPDTTLREIRDRYFKSDFSQIYDLIEYLSEYSNDEQREPFLELCNAVLARERAAFRFASGILVRVTDEDQRQEIENAVNQSKSSAVATHIATAARFYGDSKSPDYRNSIKESISAVEAAVAFLCETKPGGVSKPLRTVIDQYVVHPALRDGFEKLYAYTSDSDGIRHALLDESTLTQADARYMLVSCSAFANYLLAKKVEKAD